MSFAAPDQPARQAQTEPPKPIRLAVRYLPDVGYRRIFLVTGDGTEVDISASVDSITAVDINPRGPSKITLAMSADVDEIDWEFHAVGALGDPVAAVDRQALQAVIGSAIAGSGFAEPAEAAATTAVLEHLRATFSGAA